MTQAIKDVIIVSTALWSETAKTNKQWMAEEFLKRKINCHYIEPFASRLPRFSVADVSRTFRVMLGFLYSRKNNRQSNINIYSVPYFARIANFIPRKIIKLIDSFFQLLSLSRLIKNLDNSGDILIIYYHPYIGELEKLLSKNPKFKTISLFHAVDDLDQLPWAKNNPMSVKKGILNNLTSCDKIICTNPEISKSYSKFFHNKDVYLEPNRIPSLNRDYRQRDYKQKNIACIATFTSLKVDYEWLSWLVDHDNQVKLSLIGPIDSSCNKQDLFKKLCQHPRVTWHGSVNYSEISKLLRSQNYGIVFPSDNLYTRSSTPMKFLDYMSNGLYAYDEKYAICVAVQ